MQFGTLAALAVSALVIASGATAAMATQGSGPLGAMADGEQVPANQIETDGAIDITVDGNVTPGETVTLTALLDGEPVRFAEVSVNGDESYETNENGSVVVTVPHDDEFEVEIEAEREGELEIPLQDDDDEMEDDDDVDDEASDDESLDLSVDGNVSAGENVTITATHADYPVAGATVSVNGEHVGETDSSGTITVTVPDADEFEVEVEYEAEGELEIPLESDEDDDGDGDDADDEGQIDLVVDGTLEPGEDLSVTALDADGNVISNATVSVNDEIVGETGEDGTLIVEIPEDDELEIEVTHDDRDAELAVDFEDAEDESDSDDDDDGDDEDDDTDDDDDEEADDDDEEDDESDE